MFNYFVVAPFKGSKYCSSLLAKQVINIFILHQYITVDKVKKYMTELQHAYIVTHCNAYVVTLI